MLDAGKGLDDKCSICLKYKKPKSRAVVGFSLARDFNETVAMDVKQIKNNCILHLIDHATGAIIHSKHKKVIIDKIFKHWIALFGTQNLFLSDNSGEFINVFREIGKQFRSNLFQWNSRKTQCYNWIYDGKSSIWCKI